MSISFQYFSHGPGYWKLNTSLVKNIDYVEKMNKLIEIEIANGHDKKFGETWELLKLAVRGSTIQFAARKKRAKSNELEVL